MDKQETSFIFLNMKTKGQVARWFIKTEANQNMKT